MVIVGAGPAGACLALLLTQAGIAVTLVEAMAHHRKPWRGEALMPSGLEVLERMGLLPLLAQIPSRPLTGWRFVVNGRQLFTATEPLDGDPPQPCTLVSQEALISALIQRARSTGLLTLIGPASATKLLQSNGRIRGVGLADDQHLLADLVVACDGRQSLLRREAGIALGAQSSPIDVLWFELAGPAPCPLKGQFTTVVGRQGTFSIFERASGGQQLGWVLDRDAPTPRRSHQEWIELFTRQGPADLAGWLRQASGHLRGPTRLKVQVGMAETWWRPGLLLLGDAAHPMSPVRAQGINMALRDAWLASQLLIPLLQEPDRTDAPDALAAVESARRPEIEQLQQLQAEEASRGEWLRRHDALRCAIAASAPWIGSAIGRHWCHQQKPLRHGLASLKPAS